MTWKGWENYVPPTREQVRSAPPKTSIKTAGSDGNISESTRAQQASAPPAKQKYGAVKTTIDGITFDSKKEAARYVELRLLQAAGEIFGLMVQPRFRLLPFWPTWKGEAVPELGAYVADFSYHLSDHCCCAWGCVVEDVKGFKTPLYRWKKKHVEAQYGITIFET